MGIEGLTPFLKKHVPEGVVEVEREQFFSRVIAIDISVFIYQFLFAVRQGGDVLRNKDGDVTSHIQGLLSRTIHLMEKGIKVVYVFDGKAPELKRQELDKRRERRTEATEKAAEAREEGNVEEMEKQEKRTASMKHNMADDCFKLLNLMGIPTIRSPSEAEAQCAELVKGGRVFAMASNDMDSLCYGIPTLLRNMGQKDSSKRKLLEYRMDVILSELELTPEQFVDMCIMFGCDYIPRIKGLGVETAYKLMKEHGSLEGVLQNLPERHRKNLPDFYPFEEARRLFHDPDVIKCENIPKFSWKRPKEKGLLKFLVEENSFSEQRVLSAIERLKKTKKHKRQSRIDSFFKPVPRKDSKKRTSGASGAKKQRTK
ncbi:hypothetical protein PCE1_001735 [Barthelona sp. PCE]